MKRPWLLKRQSVVKKLMRREYTPRDKLIIDLNPASYSELQMLFMIEVRAKLGNILDSFDPRGQRLVDIADALKELADPTSFQDIINTFYNSNEFMSIRWHKKGSAPKKAGDEMMQSYPWDTDSIFKR